MASLFPPGTQFVDKQGRQFGVDHLAGKRRIGIYFSAHWCPPCRGFTPLLATAYNALRKTHPDFEIVFVSSDKDEGQFEAYLSEMPWIALRRTEPIITNLKQSFNIEGIPTLVIVDEDGNLVTKDGRGLVQGDHPKFENLWSRLQ